MAPQVTTLTETDAALALRNIMLHFLSEHADDLSCVRRTEDEHDSDAVDDPTNSCFNDIERFQLQLATAQLSLYQWDLVEAMFSQLSTCQACVHTRRPSVVLGLSCTSEGQQAAARCCALFYSALHHHARNALMFAHPGFLRTSPTVSAAAACVRSSVLCPPQEVLLPRVSKITEIAIRKAAEEAAAAAAAAAEKGQLMAAAVYPEPTVPPSRPLLPNNDGVTTFIGGVLEDLVDSVVGKEPPRPAMASSKMSFSLFAGSRAAAQAEASAAAALLDRSGVINGQPLAAANSVLSAQLLRVYGQFFVRLTCASVCHPMNRMPMPSQ